MVSVDVFVRFGNRYDVGQFPYMWYFVVVRYFSPNLPMCLRCFMLMLSGPVELLFLLLLIAAWIGARL